MLFLFDMGEVVIKKVRTLDKIAARYGLDYKELREDYGFYDRALMEGFMDPDDYYRHLEIRYGIDIREDLFRTAFTPVLNEFMIGIADKLRANGHRTAVASNTFRPHWDYILSMADSPASHFDALYASHLIQRAKPECFRWRCCSGRWMKTGLWQKGSRQRKPGASKRKKPKWTKRVMRSCRSRSKKVWYSCCCRLRSGIWHIMRSQRRFPNMPPKCGAWKAAALPAL